MDDEEHQISHDDPQTPDSRATPRGETSRRKRGDRFAQK